MKEHLRPDTNEVPTQAQAQRETAKSSPHSRSPHTRTRARAHARTRARAHARTHTVSRQHTHKLTEQSRARYAMTMAPGIARMCAQHTQRDSRQCGRRPSPGAPSRAPPADSHAAVAPCAAAARTGPRVPVRRSSLGSSWPHRAHRARMGTPAPHGRCRWTWTAPGTIARRCRCAAALGSCPVPLPLAPVVAFACLAALCSPLSLRAALLSP
eukprot:1447610-Prymnesium_polylepis.1